MFWKRKCSHCGSRKTEHGSRWARGWNHMCEQAYSDSGLYCENCHTITWDTPIEQHLKTLPNWCTPA